MVGARQSTGDPRPGHGDGLDLGSASVHADADRAWFIAAAGLPEAPRWLTQRHGTAVAVEPQGGEIADAAVSRSAGRVLAVLTADCLPVLLAAGDGTEVAVIHAGWRGLAAGVIEATLAACTTPRRRLHAWLGPAIGARSYEVGPELRDRFARSDEHGFVPVVARSGGRGPGFRLDLKAIARQRLNAAGVEDVSDCGWCTVEGPLRWHSHRADGTGRRMATLIWRR